MSVANQDQHAAVVAIVEDEPALRENYAMAFTKAGYAVRAYGDAETAWSGIDATPVDIAIIDVGLGRDPDAGFELCRRLRAAAPALPLLFLTARDSELDVVSGLRLGADDYLTKDISLAHLVARVSALLRRTQVLLEASQTQDRQQLGSLAIDADRLCVWWNDERVDLTVTEYWLVHSLVRYPGQVKTRQQLMDAANVVLDDQTITAHIKRIRKKFVALDARFSAIQTEYGRGYRWLEQG